MPLSIPFLPTHTHTHTTTHQVTEVYLEDVRAFCPLLRTDLRLSSFLDSAAKKSGAGGGGGAMYVRACLPALVSLGGQ